MYKFTQKSRVSKQIRLNFKETCTVTSDMKLTMAKGTQMRTLSCDKLNLCLRAQCKSNWITWKGATKNNWILCPPVPTLPQTYCYTVQSQRFIVIQIGISFVLTNIIIIFNKENSKHLFYCYKYFLFIFVRNRSAVIILIWLQTQI